MDSPNPPDAPTVEEAVARLDAVTARLEAFALEGDDWLLATAKSADAPPTALPADDRARVAGQLAEGVREAALALEDVFVIKRGLLVLDVARDNPAVRRAVVGTLGLLNGQGMN